MMLIWYRVDWSCYAVIRLQLRLFVHGFCQGQLVEGFSFFLWMPSSLLMAAWCHSVWEVLPEIGLQLFSLLRELHKSNSWSCSRSMMSWSFVSPCNLWPVMASLEMTGICVMLHHMGCFSETKSFGETCTLHLPKNLGESLNFRTFTSLFNFDSISSILATCVSVGLFSCSCFFVSRGTPNLILSEFWDSAQIPPNLCWMRTQ